jgi:hypothetical protein
MTASKSKTWYYFLELALSSGVLILLMFLFERLRGKCTAACLIPAAVLRHKGPA